MLLENYSVTSAQELRLLANMYVVSRAIHTVAELKIADLFEDSQTKSIEQLSSQCNLSPVALEKTLRVLCPFGLFKENTDGTYSIEEAGLLLKSDHPSKMRDLLFCEDARWNSFGQMSHTLQTGESGFSKLYQQEYFDYISKDPHNQLRFDEHMKAVSAKEDLDIAKYLPLEDKKRVIDVGGGKGGLMKAILERFPETCGGVFDLEGVGEKELRENTKKFGQRFEAFSGSFFDPLPFEADSLILKRVLHDWDDKSSIQILKQCSKALASPNSKMYIVESVVKGKEDAPLFRIFDLLLLTVFGGFERTIDAYEHLFLEAGLKIQKMIPTGSEMTILVAGKS